MRRVDVSRQRGTPPEGFSTKTTFSGVYQSHKVVFPVDVILQLGVSVEALPAVFTLEEVRGPEVFEKRAPALEHFGAQVTEKRSLWLDINGPAALTSLDISVRLSVGPVLEVLQY